MPNYASKINIDGTEILLKGVPSPLVSRGIDGLCPALPSGSGTTKYLREDGQWIVPPTNLIRESGTLTAGSGITLSHAICEKYGKVVKIFAYCGGDVTANATLFTIPSGFRPATTTYSIAIATINGNSATPYVIINTNGTVVAQLAGRSYGVEVTYIIS